MICPHSTAQVNYVLGGLLLVSRKVCAMAEKLVLLACTGFLGLIAITVLVCMFCQCLCGFPWGTEVYSKKNILVGSLACNQIGPGLHGCGNVLWIHGWFNNSVYSMQTSNATTCSNLICQRSRE